MNYFIETWNPDNSTHLSNASEALPELYRTSRPPKDLAKMTQVLTKFANSLQQNPRDRETDALSVTDDDVRLLQSAFVTLGRHDVNAAYCKAIEQVLKHGAKTSYCVARTREGLLNSYQVSDETYRGFLTQDILVELLKTLKEPNWDAAAPWSGSQTFLTLGALVHNIDTALDQLHQGYLQSLAMALRDAQASEHPLLHTSTQPGLSSIRERAIMALNYVVQKNATVLQGGAHPSTLSVCHVGNLDIWIALLFSRMRSDRDGRAKLSDHFQKRCRAARAVLQKLVVGSAVELSGEEQAELQECYKTLNNPQLRLSRPKSAEYLPFLPLSQFMRLKSLAALKRYVPAQARQSLEPAVRQPKKPLQTQITKPEGQRTPTREKKIASRANNQGANPSPSMVGQSTFLTGPSQMSVGMSQPWHSYPSAPGSHWSPANNAVLNNNPASGLPQTPYGNLAHYSTLPSTSSSSGGTQYTALQNVARPHTDTMRAEAPHGPLGYNTALQTMHTPVNNAYNLQQPFHAAGWQSWAHSQLGSQSNTAYSNQNNRTSPSNPHPYPDVNNWYPWGS